MSQMPHLGEITATNARLFPQKLGASDLSRSMTFQQWNERSCRFANGLIGLGLTKGDRVAIFAYNCLEWLEIYAAVAKAGLVAVPLNFRLAAPEIRYIIENAEASALVVQDDLLASVEETRQELPIHEDRFIHFGSGEAPPGYQAYEEIIRDASATEPDRQVGPTDPFALLYTSGTTGKPKGAIRRNGELVLHSYINQVDFGFSRDDRGLLVMPMCHANSIFFMFAFVSCGASCAVYDRRSFEPEHLLRTLAAGHFTFTSLVPTHYIMMLGLPEQTKQTLDVSNVTKLLISSAPARRETKLALIEYFRYSRLYEGYGSTEMGWVTFLRPEEQLSKLGSIGRE
ncbi:MAG TPA: AMP-binding protein, partial [Bauldia sp.]|nr:AMP-binding protein [Bauldia sp.]